MSGDRAVLEHALQRILWELHSYLPDIVIIGGWVPYLHRRYGWAAAWNSALSLTAEVDVLVPANLPAHGRKSLAEILGGAGFKPTSSNDDAAAVRANDPRLGKAMRVDSPRAAPLGDLLPHPASRGTDGRRTLITITCARPTTRAYDRAVRRCRIRSDTPMDAVHSTCIPAARTAST
jgi:hypothetical protein